MSEDISIKAHMDQCLKYFDGLNVNKKTIRRYLMRSVGNGAKRAAKQGYGEVLKKRTGTLYKSIYSHVTKGGNKAIISNKAHSGKRTSEGLFARYGFMLASGYTIESKTSRGLRFNIDGKWITKHEVTVQPKDWLTPPVNRYMNSVECSADLDKALEKQLDYWGKRLAGEGNK